MPEKRVFNRKGQGHPLDLQLDSLAEQTIEKRAFAFNVRYDHRVSPEREHVFLSYASVDPPRDLYDVAVDYFDQRIRTQEEPDFLADWNTNNVAYSPRFRRISRNAQGWLGRLLDLSGLTLPYLWAAAEGIAPFVQVAMKGVARFLDDELEGVTAERQARFVDQVLGMLSARRKRFPFQPAWVTEWDDLSPYLEEPAERWLERVGIAPQVGAHLPTHRWLIVLKYPVRRTGTLLRPTQLDTRVDARHFPSAPGADVDEGGRAMSLGSHELEDDREPLREFIHQEIDLSLDDWTQAGSRVAKVKPSARNGIGPCRARHRTSLLKLPPSLDADWLNPPI